MEYELSRLYDDLLGARTYGALAGYGTLVSGSARLELVTQAADHFPASTPALTKELGDTLKLVGKFAARRNEIAHGVCTKVKGKEGWYLAPAWYHTKKKPIGIEVGTKKYNFGVGLYAYTVEQVDAYADHFHTLTYRIQPLIFTVRSELQAWLESLRE